VTTPGHRGRFEGFDVLGQTKHWDPVTQGVVLRRLGPPAPLRFLTEDEGAIARPLLDRLLAQDDDPRIDVLAEIDSRLALEVTDGWHYDDMPRDGQAWRDTLAALDDDARREHGRGFALCDAEQQMALIQQVQDSKDAWHGMPAEQVWSLWTRYACAAFYAHPWAWNEIGFGGPAYPRGYKSLGFGSREPWEKRERDARDPVPWATRTEQARKAHLDRFGGGS
jgi:gluconate 2-dehydrogenase subunit 3-like protein